MHDTRQNTQAKLRVWLVRIQNLHRDDEWACQKVIVHHPVEDVNLSVVGARGEQRVTGVEGYTTNSFCVVPGK